MSPMGATTMTASHSAGYQSGATSTARGLWSSGVRSRYQVALLVVVVVVVAVIVVVVSWTKTVQRLTFANPVRVRTAASAPVVAATASAAVVLKVSPDQSAKAKSAHFLVSRLLVSAKMMVMLVTDDMMMMIVVAIN